MADVIFDVLHIPGLLGVLLATFLAGLIYGFAGFGAALIYMPLASIWLPLPMAVAAFSVAAIGSLVTLVPRALRHAERGPTVIMLVSALLTAPLGIAVLRVVPQDPLRWMVAAVVAGTLAVLMTGWRYRAQPSVLARLGVGAGTGIVGGATGLTGPVVVLFHLSGQGSAQSNRANSLVFLTVLSILLVPQLALQGLLTRDALVLGVLQVLPYAAGSRIGQAFFDPDRETLYRRVAYALIAGAVIMGVPKSW